MLIRSASFIISAVQGVIQHVSCNSNSIQDDVEQKHDSEDTRTTATNDDPLDSMLAIDIAVDSKIGVKSEINKEIQKDIQSFSNAMDFLYKTDIQIDQMTKVKNTVKESATRSNNMGELIKEGRPIRSSSSKSMSTLSSLNKKKRSIFSYTEKAMADKKSSTWKSYEDELADVIPLLIIDQQINRSSDVGVKSSDALAVFEDLRKVDMETDCAMDLTEKRKHLRMQNLPLASSSDVSGDKTQKRRSIFSHRVKK